MYLTFPIVTLRSVRNPPKRRRSHLCLSVAGFDWDIDVMSLMHHELYINVNFIYHWLGCLICCSSYVSCATKCSRRRQPTSTIFAPSTRLATRSAAPSAAKTTSRHMMCLISTAKAVTFKSCNIQFFACWSLTYYDVDLQCIDVNNTTETTMTQQNLPVFKC